MRLKFDGFRFWHKILLLLAISIIVLVGAISWLVWQSLKEAAENMGLEGRNILSGQTETYLEKLIASHAATLDVQLEQARSAAVYGSVYLKDTLERNDASARNMRDLLATMHDSVRHCAYVAFVPADRGPLQIYPENPTGDPDGILRDLAASSPSVSTPYWTDVQAISDGHELIVHIIDDIPADDIPADTANRARGSIVVGLSLNRLIAQFNQHQPIRGGYTFLIDSRRRLIGAPPHARIELSSAREYKATGIIDLKSTDHPDLDAVLKRMVLGESAIAAITLDNDEKYIAYHPLNAINWSMGIVIPVKMATATAIQLVDTVEQGIRNVLQRIFFWASWLLLLSLIGGFLLSRQLARPIRMLSDATKEFADGNFSKRVEISSRDELKGFADAFNFMTGKIEHMVDDLHHANETLNLQNIELETEIDKRRQALEKLQESEERYRLLVETMNEGIVVIDEDGVFTFSNSTFCRMLEMDKAQLSGVSVFSLLNDHNRSILRQELDKRKRGIAEPYELAWQTPDGNNVPTRLSPVPILDADGNFKGSFAVVTNIRELRQAEENLRKSEERFKSLTENSPDIIFTMEQDDIVSYINPAVELLLNYNRESCIGKSFFDLVASENVPVCRNAFSKVLHLRQTIRDVDIRMRQNDRTLRQFNLSAAPNVGLKGDIQGIIGICRDVTEYRKLENQFHNAMKMEAIGTLAGGIAHDFNNLLTGIIGNASLLLLDMDKSDPRHTEIEAIQTYAQSGAELTRQLLGFARGGKYETKPTDLNTVVDETAVMFWRTHKEIQLHRNLEQNLWIVEADRGQMEQVLLNLFVNAWHAMPDGGDLYLVTQNLDLAITRPESYEMPPGKYVRLSVTDTGVGMSEAVRRRIFEPFFSTKKRGRGTGLGLASAYGIVKNHGGMITVYSVEGKGSTFNVYLPASKTQATEQAASPAMLHQGEGLILLIDDEEMILNVGRRMLEIMGYQVMTASSGEEAMNHYRVCKERISLVILDMILPNEGGGAIFEKLLAENPNVKVLLSSGYSLNGQAEKILDRGCKGFLQKPFTFQQLSEKIGEIIANSG